MTELSPPGSKITGFHH